MRLLADECKENWAHIERARDFSQEQYGRIAKSEDVGRLIAVDTALMVFGSLAREEATSNSDLDWALLVDGQVDGAHFENAQAIRYNLAQLGFRSPGPTELFGGLVFSHELVQQIGGEADTNRNTTRRVLLLLESISIQSPTTGSGDVVRERVLRQLIGRYIDDDFGYRPEGPLVPYVPGFLLNDFVRYWRTMAVDFAAKRRDRGGAGWALRRLKLRMSRKLIFAAGLANCLSCKLRPSGALDADFSKDDDLSDAMKEYLFDLANVTPLDALARFVRHFNATDAGKQIFSAYDAFLGLLSDETRRRELEDLPPGPSSAAVYCESDDIARKFGRGLEGLFFTTDNELTRITQRFGVF